MRVVITELTTGTCELSGKTETEVVRVQLDENSPPAVIATSSLIKLLRFKQTQQAKQNLPPSRPGT